LVKHRDQSNRRAMVKNVYFECLHRLTPALVQLQHCLNMPIPWGRFDFPHPRL
jgi:hypothetical protein